MEYNKDKVDEAVLALLYLNFHKQSNNKLEPFSAWKSFDWDSMGRLYDKGFISNPAGKAKLIVMTDEGAKKSEELFRMLFKK